MSRATGRARTRDRDRAQLRARVAELEVALAEREEMLEAIRTALGHGAHEHLWPPGLTMAEAVTRLCAGHTHLHLVTLAESDSDPTLPPATEPE